MLKKYVIVTLVAGLLNLFLAASTFARSTDEKKAALAEKVKSGIVKLGTGPAAKVEVKLYDNTKLKGYVGEAKDDHFVIVEANTGGTTEVPYHQVKQMKGNNLSGGVKILIGIGIILIAIPIIIALSDRHGG